jgi:hypothetical protein
VSELPTPDPVPAGDAVPVADPVRYPQAESDASLEHAIGFAIGDPREAMAYAMNFADEAALGESGLESFFFGDTTHGG